jgi:hypothetical protein
MLCTCCRLHLLKPALRDPARLNGNHKKMESDNHGPSHLLLSHFSLEFRSFFIFLKSKLHVYKFHNPNMFWTYTACSEESELASLQKFTLHTPGVKCV